MCLYPKLIKNPKYKGNKKNNYNPPELTDIRVGYVPVGCGKCIECRKQKARSWQVRLNEEIKHRNDGNMITLTFSEDALNNLKKNIINEEIDENEIATIAVRRFLERWRKTEKKSIKHWLITELGHTNTERIHLHGIIFTNKPELIEEKWQYGFITLGNGITNYVNERTINYIIKYVTKIDKDHKNFIPKILCSPGIGANYTKKTDAKNNKYNNEKTNETYRTRTGLKLNLPIYYRNKIYSEEEREKLWINKIEKKERWIMGEKIKIDTIEGEIEYQKTLEYYQQKNKRLGYGDRSKEWDIEQYKEQRKIINAPFNEKFKLKRQS